MGFCRAGIVIVVLVVWAPALSSLPTVEGFHLKWTSYTKGPVATKFRFRNDKKRIPESRSCSSIERQHHRFFGSDAFATITTSTSLTMMVDENTKDPDVLLQMVEQLAMEEFTPETMAKMGEVEIALANVLDDISAALLEQEEERLDKGRPRPPSVPPPGSLLEMDESNEPQQQMGWRQQQQQDRDLATDLAKAGTALELLQQLLQSEEEAVLEELALQLDCYEEQQQQQQQQQQQYESTTIFDDEQQQEYFEEQQQQQQRQESASISRTNLDEQNVLFQAEEALKKSKEAAEKRRLEAERRSVTAARVSASYRQQQQQEQEEQQQEEQQQQQYHHQEGEQDESTTQPFGAGNPYVEEHTSGHQNQQQDAESEEEDLWRTKKRATIELGSLFGKRGTEDSVPETITDSRVPEGVPVLYNWIQDEDGSITGNIRGSMNFRDGATISTSCVSKGAREGTTIATQSGSRYFLEEPTTTTEEFGEEQYRNDIVALQESPTPTTWDGYASEAPDGVPTVKSWEVRNDGGIIGLIYDSPYADDGDYVETSPIVEGPIDNFSVVSTLSGTRYFLSGDPPEDSLDTLENFKDELIPTRTRQGTITLSPPTQQRQRQQQQQQQRAPRSTFSLFNLFDGGGSDDETTNNIRRTYLHGPPQPLPPPSPDKVPPPGTPALTGCVFNNDGTITGYVFGSANVGDGMLITTSPIVDGERKPFETVRTASGSMYYLG